MTEQSTFPNRAVQFEILQKLKKRCPAIVNVQRWDESSLAAELVYLRDLGLV